MGLWFAHGLSTPVVWTQSHMQLCMSIVPKWTCLTTVCDEATSHLRWSYMCGFVELCGSYMYL